MRRLPRFSRPRDLAATVTVSALSAGFGTALIQASSVLDRATGAGPSGDEVVGAVVTVMVLLSVYTASIVTANTFSTVIAGRTADIALLRLVGATARSIRRDVAREGLVVGVVGAAVGVALALVVVRVAVAVGVALGRLPDVSYGFVSGTVLYPAAAVVLTTWLASLVGSARVLRVEPVQATRAAQEPTPEAARRRPLRTVCAVLLFVGGTMLTAVGLLFGLITPAGVVIAFCGGASSFTGIVVGAYMVVPRTLRLAASLLGRQLPARLAAENAVRYPARSIRATLGLLVGVTLVTTIVVADATFDAAARASGLADLRDLAAAFATASAVMTALVCSSVVIAVVGLVDSLSLSVMQRTRELGLLRALGMSTRQVRQMIAAESLQMSAAAIGLGLLLGTGYGWSAAQSMLPSIIGRPFVVPVLPIPLVIGAIVGTAGLAVLAMVRPSRRATRVSPVRALAVDR